MNLKSFYYVGEGERKPDITASLPQPRPSGWRSAGKYLPGSGLVDAANVALLLRQPLILTGAPGTGKTQFAASLAHELGLPEPFKFETKSTSQARDLFYTYDALQRFQDVQSGSNPKSILPYLNYQPLGKAILLAREWKENESLVDEKFPKPEKPSVSVVLIDEIDKAPRDFPNDILNEIEKMEFHIPEMGIYNIKAEEKYRPIVIITSNSEKDLPDAFLRRCVYYNIPAPDQERLKSILMRRLEDDLKNADGFVGDVLSLFMEIRDAGNLMKAVSTAELLDWVLALRRVLPDSPNPLAELAQQTDPQHLESSRLFSLTQTTLIKNTQDPEVAMEEMRTWLTTRQANENQT